jgi:hypothetical protein
MNEQIVGIEFVAMASITIGGHWCDLMLTYFEEVLQDMGMGQKADYSYHQSQVSPG